MKVLPGVELLAFKPLSRDHSGILQCFGPLGSSAMATDLLVKDLKKLFSLLFWSAFLLWMFLWILWPTAFGEKLVVRAKQKTPSFAGDYSAILIVYSSPVILSSIFGLLLLHLKRAYPKHRSPRSRTRAEPGSKGLWKRFQNLMWTQPLVTRGPLGVATGFDILAITVVLVAVAWIYLKTLIPELCLINYASAQAAAPLGETHKYQKRMVRCAGALSRAALLPLTLLFFPVSRGSPMLRTVDIPFQHAVKYHRWLGHLTLTLFIAHAVLNICVLVSEHVSSKLLQWPPTGISFLAGIIAFAAGLLMWLTAIAPIRRRWFELFYVVHHLYMVFFTFLVFHAGTKMSSYTAVGMFLFCVDRFIRAVQSRHGLSLAAIKVYRSGVMELKLRKAPGVAYNELSFVFINIPCVSRLQWHPFSVTSSPIEDVPTLSICIKPVGAWTKRLHRSLTASDAGAPTSIRPFSNLVFAEGTYGPASDFLLEYDALFLVAGGIGITPFIAILRDLFYRYQQVGRERDHRRRLPKSIQLIWTMKTGSELTLLTDIFPAKRFSNAMPHFECHAFLTAGSLDGGTDRCDTGALIDRNDAIKNEITMNFPNVSGREGSLSCVAATGNCLWVASLVAVASFATILAMYVFNKSTTSGHSQEGSSALRPVSDQHIALLYLGSMVVGISGFGGVVMGTWSLLRNMDSSENHVKRTSSVYEQDYGTPGAGVPLPDGENIWERNLLENTSIMRGRPNLPKYFNTAAECYRGKDVGVLVCGPESLQRSVAAECKSHYMSPSVSPFYFHSLSFDL